MSKQYTLTDMKQSFSVILVLTSTLILASCSDISQKTTQNPAPQEVGGNYKETGTPGNFVKMPSVGRGVIDGEYYVNTYAGFKVGMAPGWIVAQDEWRDGSAYLKPELGMKAMGIVTFMYPLYDKTLQNSKNPSISIMVSPMFGMPMTFEEKIEQTKKTEKMMGIAGKTAWKKTSFNDEEGYLHSSSVFDNIKTIEWLRPTGYDIVESSTEADAQKKTEKDGLSPDEAFSMAVYTYRDLSKKYKGE